MKVAMMAITSPRRPACRRARASGAARLRRERQREVGSTKGGGGWGQRACRSDSTIHRTDREHGLVSQFTSVPVTRNTLGAGHGAGTIGTGAVEAAA